MDTILNISEIKKMLPHRYPFLLIDRIIELGDTTITAIKNVTINEPFFIGHFPEEPIMPGVLQIEAMAQAAGVLALKKLNMCAGNSIYFMTIDNVKFRKLVTPGDTLIIKMEITKASGQRFCFKGGVFVEDALVSEAEMMAMIKR